jgi:hypothetical protein
MADGRLLDGIRPRPVTAAPRERIDDRTLSRRIRSEFQEMPGTCLTVAQATRLFGVSADVGLRILRKLVDDGVLRVTADGRYRLYTAA